MTDLFGSIFSNTQAIVLAVLFFGASIFVHELGHFLAARRRGLVVKRFSIGFGPRLYTWHRNGVEYCLSALPLGGYVALPQLADMKTIEGESGETEDLPPISYSDKMIVSVMGAVFNVLFALVIASILWGIGEYGGSTTTVGAVAEELTIETRDEETGDKETVTIPSPAFEAGLQPGDKILKIDGRPVDEWNDVRMFIMAGTNRSDDGRAESLLTIERDGKTMEKVIYPELATAEKIRQIGIIAADELVVGETYPDSPAANAGLQHGDVIHSMNGKRILSLVTYLDIIDNNIGKPISMKLLRGEAQEPVVVSMIPEEVQVRSDGETAHRFGIKFANTQTIVHNNPIKQVTKSVVVTWTVLKALVAPQSDIGFSKLSGAAGISYVLYRYALFDLRELLAIIVLINVNLAIVNLLPIPVLDGGHMLFATIGKLRGKALPHQLVEYTQATFIFLLLFLVVYITVFDVKRVYRNIKDEKAYEEEISRWVEPVFGDDNPLEQTDNGANPQLEPITADPASPEK